MREYIERVMADPAMQIEFFPDGDRGHASEYFYAALKEAVLNVDAQEIWNRSVIITLVARSGAVSYRASCGADSLGLTPSGTSPYWFESNYQNGLLSMHARLTLGKRNGRIRDLYMPHLKSLVGLSLEHFRRIGREVAGICGNWSRYTNRSKNLNFQIMEQGLAMGLSYEAAALRTPTGRIAAFYGFTNAVKDTPPAGLRRESGYNVVFFR